MTRGEFESRYQLLTCIADGDVRSYIAREVATGRDILVHLLGELPTDRVSELHRQLEQIDPSDRAMVLDQTEVDGKPVVMTEPLLGFTTLPDWLESRLTSTAESGQTSDTPGEFTMLFGMPAATPPPSPPSPPSPPTPSPMQSQPRPQRGPAPIIRLGATPSAPPAAPLSPPPQAGRPLYSGPAGLPSGPWPASPPMPGLRGPSVPVRGPGEIADLIGGVSNPSPSAAADDSADASSAPDDAPAEKSRSFLPLIIILTILLLCAVGLVLYFALTSD